ncbi:MAG: bifunctional riboflavin kinase/FAD synthetase [Firmicutes bacterium]|nr:bifunctional riboflavin kinase/FAD synthetase [Bacillota bacterium]
MMDGFINLNKHIGPSSQSAVSALKRLFRVKAGHCGTLDPAAQGVLPVALGSATRLTEYVIGNGKTYRTEIVFGVETDTYDGDGNIVAEADASSLTAGDLHQALLGFCGDIMQTPPAASALKQGGVAAYKRLRRGETVTMQPRPVHIDALQLESFQPGRQARATLRIRCGKGVYVRSLAHDLGALFGVGGHVAALTRLQVGMFRIEQAYTVEQIAAMAAAGDYSFLLPSSYPLAHIPVFTVRDDQRQTILYGNPTPIDPYAAAAPLYRIEDSEGCLLAIGTAIRQPDGACLLQPEKVLQPPPPPKGRGYQAVAIGNFDGVHLGHRALLQDLAEQKRLYGGKTAALTFSPHPLAVICGQAPPLLSSDELKKHLICDVYQADDLITLPFDRRLMNAAPEEFFREVLQNKLRAQSVVVGYNFTFAAHGHGTAATLRQLGEAAGMEVRIVGEIAGECGPISSSAIRNHIAKGDMQAANAMLGYWYSLSGVVITGNRLGRTIGFPTANVAPREDLVMPPLGVYAARVLYDGQSFDGVVNFGYKPTIGGENKPLLEAHIFDRDMDLYGREITVALGKFLRPEKRFAGLQQLQRQIDEDSQKARLFLAGQAANCHLPKPIG